MSGLQWPPMMADCVGRPMLFNEVQKQAAEIRVLKQRVAELNDLKQQLRAALVALTAKDQLVAQC